MHLDSIKALRFASYATSRTIKALNIAISHVIPNVQAIMEV